MLPALRGDSAERGVTLLTVLVGVLLLLVTGAGTVLLAGRVERSALQPIREEEGTVTTEVSLQRLLEQVARSARLERRGAELQIILAPRAVQALRAAAASLGTYELGVAVKTSAGQRVSEPLVVADAVVNYQRGLRLPASALEAAGGDEAGGERTTAVFTLRVDSVSLVAEQRVRVP